MKQTQSKSSQYRPTRERRVLQVCSKFASSCKRGIRQPHLRSDYKF